MSNRVKSKKTETLFHALFFMEMTANSKKRKLNKKILAKFFFCKNKGIFLPPYSHTY